MSEQSANPAVGNFSQIAQIGQQTNYKEKKGVEGENID